MPIEQKIQHWARTQLPLYDFIGLSVLSCSNGQYKTHIPLNKNTGNHLGTMHAATQWTCAEMLGGIIVLSSRANDNYVPVVKNVDCKFLRPALSSVTAQAAFPNEQVKLMNTQLEETGRFDFTLDISVIDEQDNQVAQVVADYVVKAL